MSATFTPRTRNSLGTWISRCSSRGWIGFSAFRYREEGLFMQFRVFQKSDEAAVIRLWTRCELVRPWNNLSEDIRCKLAF